MMAEAISREVGTIEGEATATSLQIRVLKESLGRNDLVEVKHEGKTYLLIVKEAKRVKDHYAASCEVIGRGPKTPFKPGSAVFPASEESIRDVYGLITDEKEGLFIGWLRGLQTKVWIPVKKLGRTFIVGKPGSGKSYTAGVITEELMKKGIPVLIVDVHGEYSSLKIPEDRKRRSSTLDYAERIIEFGDPQLNPGADLETAVVESTRPEELLVSGQCTILNLRGLNEERQSALVKNTVSKILEAAIAGRLKPFYLLLDEAHRFAGRERSETCDVLKKFTQEGRKFGANLTVITQRPQLLDITIRSLSGTWIIHRLTDPNDTKIAAESGGLSKDWEHDINWLESGEAIVTGEIAEKLPFVVRVRQRETKHGAPGFNPLDFVSPDLLERIKHRKDTLRKRFAGEVAAPSKRREPEKQVHVAETLHQSSLKDQSDETQLIRRLKRNNHVQKAELEDHRVKLTPCLYMEATVNVARNDPPTSYSRQVHILCEASESVGSLDFSAGTVLGITPADIRNKSSLQEGTGSEGEMVPPLKALQGISEFEKIKREFNNFAAQAASLSVLKHPRLSITSEPGATPDQFMPTVLRALDERRKEEKEIIEKKYAATLSKSQKVLSKCESESRLTSKYLQEVNQQIAQYKNQKSKAQKEKKSTTQITDRIYRAELKLGNLQSKQQEIASKLRDVRNEIESIQREKQQALAEVDAKTEQLAKENLKIVHVKPRAEEVEVTSSQLVWVPIHHAHLQLAQGETTSALEVWWNGYTGSGHMGNCNICQEDITEASGKWICRVGLEPVCDKHQVICSKCGYSTCKKHAWSCKTCKKDYCDEEEHIKCVTCKENLCSNCQLKCLLCGNDRKYCEKDSARCEDCKQLFCKKHYTEHMGKCIQCEKPLCTIKNSKCAICEAPTCSEHSLACSKCARNACPLHSWECPTCDKRYCSEEKSSRCKHCGKAYCENCVKTCSVCSSELCQEGVRPCDECGRPVCSDCTVSRRRLLVMKRTLCRNCVQVAS